MVSRKPIKLPKEAALRGNVLGIILTNDLCRDLDRIGLVGRYFFTLKCARGAR